MEKVSNFVELNQTNKIWAIGSIHSNLDSFNSIKRFILKGGNKELFHVFNNKQLKDEKKIKYCDHVITNEKSIIVLKKNLLKILKRYE